jgi:hypothetical protein
MEMQLDLGEIAQPGWEVEVGSGRLAGGHILRLAEIECGVAWIRRVRSGRG